ncbi:MAG: heparinase [Crocinitomicaceae bacterium]|nr:heparinase [Crocinitomicaceae bacterium]
MLNLVNNMGARYVFFRVYFQLTRKKHKSVFPLNPPMIDRVAGIDMSRPFLLEKTGAPAFQLEKADKETLAFKAEQILSGNILFFNHEWKNLGLDYDWITNPDSGFRYDSTKHWSEIQDFNPTSGDIKYVWEKSRFAYLLTIMRYDFHFGQDHSKFVFEEIESWINANPVNQGPNWKCSQEISLRIFNWCFVLDYYRNSPELTPERFNRILHVIYWSLDHVYKNINFSRIAVRNNHAITETLFLALSELMFPFFPETKKWAADGRKWFEQEVDYQVYDDGTYLQFSMNYHRVVIQLLSLGISVSARAQKPFSEKVSEKAYKSLDFLYQCLQEENGMLPNYGNNDGALFFPLSDQDYRDYRPQLNHLHHILTGRHIYADQAEITEDALWLPSSSTSTMEAVSKKYGALSYPVGGFYLYRNEKSFTMIRCGKYKDRPHQADNLHLDVWIGGENVLRDSGTYKYNTDKIYSDYFTGTVSHNTVSIGDQSQMLKGGRFIWYYWSQALDGTMKENENEVIFEGRISCFRYIRRNIQHRRTVRISKQDLHWTVEDTINADGASQNWHFGKGAKPEMKSESNGSVIQPTTFPSYDSSYYGTKTGEESLYFEFGQEIKTEIQF